MKRKLSQEQVGEILTLVEGGWSDTKIAGQFGVSRPVISGLRLGKTYRTEQKKPGPKSQSVEERFWKRVICPDDPDECWGWTGASRNGTTYGSVSKGGKSQPAYRISFEIHYHEIPDDQWVLHTCDNVICTNPVHLYLGDRDEWARKWHRKDPMTEEEALLYAESLRAKRGAYYEENKESRREYVTKYQLKKKIAAITVLGGKCQKCPEKHPAALQFHHRDPSEKSFSVNSKTLSSPGQYPWKLIVKEIDKCELLCGNCHAKHHSSWNEDMVSLMVGYYGDR
jgi:5-methylcytosine-specific restriction endonuclease McrA